MKNFIIRFITMVSFTTVFASCVKEIDSQTPEDQPVGSEFTIRLVQTKTVNNGYSTE